VRQLVKDKAAGNEIVVSAGPPAEATNVTDLLDALKRSVADARAGRPAPEPKRPARRRKQEAKRSGPARQRPTRKSRASRAELSQLTKSELYQRATDLDIPGRSTMKRDELEKAVGKAAAAT
jgi:DNA end-binding protein Ku